METNPPRTSADRRAVAAALTPAIRDALNKTIEVT